MTSLPSPVDRAASDSSTFALRRGACFGYAVTSELSFCYLRTSGGSEALTVTERSDASEIPSPQPTMEWTRRPGYDLHVRLYAEKGQRHRMWTDREGWFDIDPCLNRITVPVCDDHIRREERVWGIPAVVCMLANGDLPLHAAAVEIDGGALLLAAPGTFGKTTLAASFHRFGYRLLAEDLSACRFTPSPVLLPGPAMLRVRRDMYDQLNLPDTNVVAEEPGRVHLAISNHRRGSGDPLPLRGVMFLRTGGTGPSVEPVTPERALPDLWTLSFKLPHDEDRARSFERLAHLASEVPIWNLTRPLRIDNLTDVVEAIVASCGDT